MRFNPSRNTIIDVLNCIDSQKNKMIQFLINNDDNTTGYGEGASRQIYQQCLKNMVDIIFVKTNNFFVDFNPDSVIIFNYGNYIEHLISFIRMALALNIKLPFHLPIRIYESAVSRQSTIDELKYFLSHVDPTMYENIKNITDENFHEYETGHVSLVEMLREKLVYNDHMIDESIYEIFGIILKDHLTNELVSIKDLDSEISGEFIITPDIFIDSMNVIPQKYHEMFSNFIKSLTPNELKNALIQFGNDSDINNKYRVEISSAAEIDLTISTCYRNVVISEKLFESEETLNNLRLYFTDNIDILVDDRSNYETDEDDRSYHETDESNYENQSDSDDEEHIIDNNENQLEPDEEESMIHNNEDDNMFVSCSIMNEEYHGLMSSFIEKYQDNYDKSHYQYITEKIERVRNELDELESIYLDIDKYFIFETIFQKYWFDKSNGFDIKREISLNGNLDFDVFVEINKEKSVLIQFITETHFKPSKMVYDFMTYKISNSDLSLENYTDNILFRIYSDLFNCSRIF